MVSDLSPPSKSFPTPADLRAKLEALIRLDLFGPKNGPDEELDESKVSDRYLVGMLAPAGTPVGADQDEDFTATTEEDGSGGDGKTESATPRADSLFPSSIGTSFVVDGSCTSLRVTAQWGQYLREKSDNFETKTGEPKTVWCRHPRGGMPYELPLREGRVEPFAPDASQPLVRVTGRVRRRDDRWVVTLFLVNEQGAPEENKDEVWLFQVSMVVEGPSGTAVFRRKDVVPPRRDGDPRNHEDRQMAMSYRRDGEFAVGHGTAVHVEVDPADPWRARRIETVAVPVHEVRQQTARTAEDRGSEKMRGLVLDMKALAEAEPQALAGMLEPLADAYEQWIGAVEEGRGEAEAHLEPFGPEVDETLARCKRALARIREGIALLGEADHPEAAEAFRFANRAMWQQRIQSQVSELRRRGDERSMADLVAELDADPGRRSWYPFQLAFVLLNLASVTDPKHPDREHVADLLWFPTGGGKTEAYLGLSAYVMGLRRLQGVVEDRVGTRGMAVLMRYTLRLLTVQQFQRAAALICACETIRRGAMEQGDTRWGREPFRIGLWVGSRNTPNTTSAALEAIEWARGQERYRRSGASGSPAQFTACPWCGTRIDPGRDLFVEKFGSGRGRTLTYCGDVLGRCPFSRRQSAKEGIPVVVVDEEIYRLLPDLVVATVDKFAQITWEGRTQMLFGQVDSLCERHGFRSPEVEDADSHVKRNDLPAAKTVPHPDLRPPDLIVQDELHLISGPLGSLVGLYETAIDELCTWQIDGHTVRPKVVASTATVRNARAQVHDLFVRRVEVFPPPGTDAADNFFSVRREPREQPGRRYLGICTPGRRLKMALIRVYLAALTGAKVLYDEYGEHADPWMTLAGYFNSLRELGGMKRLVDDDVTNRAWKMDERGLARRHIAQGRVKELTSRVASTDIPRILDELEIRFSPKDEEERKKARKEGRRVGPMPLDVLLATNMVSVGVDVQRLGLMVVAGQPKTTAEYIQATSRVGRRFPGLVVTVYNWARPRDLSHYERFEHYHATFYRHVESLSVTPFAAGSVERGLTALLVALVRQLGPEFNANDKARELVRDHEYVRRAVRAIAARAETVLQDKTAGKEVQALLERRLDEWSKAIEKVPTLGYRRKRDLTLPLLHRPDDGPWTDFTCPNSLREVEPSAGVILDESTT